MNRHIDELSNAYVKAVERAVKLQNFIRMIESELKQLESEFEADSQNEAQIMDDPTLRASSLTSYLHGLMARIPDAKRHTKWVTKYARYKYEELMGNTYEIDKVLEMREQDMNFYDYGFEEVLKEIESEEFTTPIMEKDANYYKTAIEQEKKLQRLMKSLDEESRVLMLDTRLAAANGERTEDTARISVTASRLITQVAAPISFASKDREMKAKMMYKELTGKDYE